mgnify:CR=1 FL=1
MEKYLIILTDYIVCNYKNNILCLFVYTKWTLLQLLKKKPELCSKKDNLSNGIDF